MEVSNQQGSKAKLNNSYDNYNQGKPICRSDCGQNRDEINDNISEKANSVQTSYKYQKKKNGPNTYSSKDYNNPQGDDELSFEISENDNLICPNCINCTLIEEKQRREELDKQRERDYNRNYEYGGGDYNNALYDRNRNYDRNLIDEKRRQREYNTNEAIQNLAKINAGMSNKDKLIQRNENSRNPLNDGLPDYQYQRFQDEYERRQKMINDNISKYYPNVSNERPEIKSYYDNYVYNPKYNGNRNDGYNNTNKYGEYGPSGGPYCTNKKQYIRDLEDQINYKNEMKKREKEEERRRGQKQYEDIQRDLKREDEERYLKEKRQQEELIRANNELINQKNKMKLKDLEDKLKYRELCDRQNEEYQRDLQRQQMEKERMKDDIYNHNKNEQIKREREKEREREREINEGRYGPGYGGPGGKYADRFGPGAGGKYDERYRPGTGGKYNERYGPGEGGKYGDRYGVGGKYGDRYGEGGKYGDRYGEGGKYGDRYGEGGKYGDRYGEGGKYGDRYGSGEGDRYGDRYGNLGDNINGKGGKYGLGDNRYDDGKYGNLGDNRGGIGARGKDKERMGRCCRCHRIFPRRLLTINRYFYKENRK